MINKNFIKSILPGLLPLFIFIVADEIWGTRIGLYVALIFGLLELVYTYIKTKKIEKFILSDTLLLVALGGISIILDNDIFFKLKPAIIESILALIIGISAFGSKNIILNMSKRYLKNVDIPLEQSHLMQKSMKGIFYITSFHIVLIIYSAFFLSNEAWAFISGGLFYIIFIGYFVFEFIKNKRKKNKIETEEILPHIDQQGSVISVHPRSSFHKGGKDKMLHPVVHLHVFNSKGEIYLQKRPIDKLVQPKMWDTSVGGHVSANEDLQLALKREIKEEIGLENIDVKFFKNYIWETEIEMELVYMFISNTDKKPKPSKTELDGGKFWTIDEIKKNIGKHIFTPNFENEFEILRNTIIN
jgi:isopentenyldiphosphate isomerase/intracellular septation protein A